MQQKRFWAISALSLASFAPIAALSIIHGQFRTFTYAVLLALFFSALIYFQIKFYREGDKKFLPNNETHAPRHASPLLFPLSSAGPRAVPLNTVQAGDGMRRLGKKEAEEIPAAREKRLLGLPKEEDILFMADASKLFFMPAALFCWALLFFSTIPSNEYPSLLSFAFFLSGLGGLLLLTLMKPTTRYYLTNFRILIRKSRSLGKTQWLVHNYSAVTSFGITDKFSRKALFIKSDKSALIIAGLSNQRASAAVEILKQKTSA